MTFLWAPLLVLVLAIPLGVAAYLARGPPSPPAAGRLRHARVRPPAERRPAARRRWRRRIPAACMVAGLALVVLALARPEAVVSVPRVEGTVILAFDVSGSMAATDLAPTRMEAAKAAARAFVERQPATVRIGVVAFSDSGFSIQVPTDDAVQVTAAIDRLAPERGTVDRPRHRHRPDDDRHRRGRARRRLLHEPLARPVARGVARARRHVRVRGDRAADRRREQPDARSARGGRRRSRAQGPDLHGRDRHRGRERRSRSRASGSTASSTKRCCARSRTRPAATYFAAADPAALTAVYDSVETRLVVRPEPMEVTSLFAGAGLLILVAGGIASLVVLGRAAVNGLAGTDRRIRGPRDGPAVARSRWCCSASCRSSSSSGSDPAAPPSGGPLLEPGARHGCACRARRGSAATCRSPCSCSPSAASPLRSRDRQRSWPCRPARRRSSWRSTCRAACAPRTSRPTGCWRPRPPPPRSSSGRARPTRIGIVAFAGFAEMVLAPTTDREVLLDVVADPGDRAAHRDRQRDPRIDRRHRRDRRIGRPEPGRGRPARGRRRRRCRRAPMRRRSSCC